MVPSPLLAPRRFGPRFVPTTPWRWAWVLALCTVVLVPVPWLWNHVAGPPLPIQVARHGTYGEWEPGNRSFLMHSGARTYATSCPVVWISRLLTTRKDAARPIAAEPVSGPLLAQGTTVPARRAVVVEPGQVPGNTARARVPDGIDPHDILGISFTVSVPTDQPCANGYTGTYQLYQVSLPPFADQPLPVDGQPPAIP